MAPYVFANSILVGFFALAALLSAWAWLSMRFSRAWARRAEATIERQRARLAGIVNSAMDGIISVDEADRIVLFNTAAERIFGYAADEIVGQPIGRLIPEARRDVAWRTGPFTDGFRGAAGPFAFLTGMRADGVSFPMEASVVQITLDGGNLCTMTCRDVTDRVQAEAARCELQTQLLQAQKMEAIGLLAGGIAHDFNNLLTVIGGYTEQLLGELPINHAFAEPIRSIQHAGECAAAMTRQLLLFSRQNVNQPVLLDLNALMKQTEKMLKRLIGEDIRFNVEADPNIGPVKADAAQLSQVLVNLAVNARDAMPSGGILTIKTESVPARRKMSRQQAAGSRQPLNATGPICDQTARRFICLSVADTGVGIPASVLPRIFEPFYTTKGVGKGTGLGLAVVHGIVEQSGGHIEVSSSVPTGTTFKIYLPESAASPQERGAAGLEGKPRGHAHPPRPAARGETILLVEDEDVVRRLAITVLEAHGYEVLQATDGAAALRLAEQHPQPIHMLLTDVVMPNLNGFDVARSLQTRFPNLKVLFMSGYSGEAIRQRGLRHDGAHLLQKPYSTHLLVAKVRELLDVA